MMSESEYWLAQHEAEQRGAAKQHSEWERVLRSEAARMEAAGDGRAGLLISAADELAGLEEQLEMAQAEAREWKHNYATRNEDAVLLEKTANGLLEQYEEALHLQLEARAQAIELKEQLDSSPHSGLEADVALIRWAILDAPKNRAIEAEQALARLIEQLEAAERKLAGVTSKTALDVVAEKMAAEDRARELKEQLEASRTALRQLHAWAVRMPDALLNDGDPRYEWWFQGAILRDHARQVLDASNPATENEWERRKHLDPSNSPCPICLAPITGPVAYCPNESCPASEPKEEA